MAAVSSEIKLHISRLLQVASFACVEDRHKGVLVEPGRSTGGSTSVVRGGSYENISPWSRFVRKESKVSRYVLSGFTLFRVLPRVLTP